MIYFINKYDILADNQYGVKKDLPAENAVLALTDEIVAHRDNNLKYFGIFLNLRKVFNTVAIIMLLDKMNRLGLRRNALKLFTSYLSDHVQCT